MPVLYRRGLMESTRVTMISPDYISPNPDQPRRYFDPDGLTELAESIRVHGILQPLSVRRKGGGRYELIAGERRLRAAMICGLEQVPCLVLEVSRESSCLLVKEGWTVSRTERYVEEVLRDQAKEKKVRRPLFIRDVRFFLNTLDHSLTVMRSAGVDAKCQRVEEGDDILLTIRIPKAKAPSGPA